MKEKDIESKFKQITAEWAVQSLTFATFKSRGELLIRGEETQESIGMMEDSLMMLSSLMSNRSVHVASCLGGGYILSQGKKIMESMP